MPGPIRRLLPSRRALGRALGCALGLAVALPVPPASAGEVLEFDEARVRVPDGLERAPQALEKVADLYAGSLLKEGPYDLAAAPGDVVSRIFCDTVTGVPQAILFVCRIASSKPVPPLTDGAVEDLRRKAGQQMDATGAVEVRRTTAGGGRYPGLEMRLQVDPGIGPVRRSHVFLLPRQSFVLVLSFDVSGEASEWNGAWESVLETLTVDAPPPGSDSGLPWTTLGLVGAGLLLLVLGARAVRGPRNVRHTWEDAAAHARSRRGPVSGGSRPADGLPVPVHPPAAADGSASAIVEPAVHAAPHAPPAKRTAQTDGAPGIVSTRATAARVKMPTPRAEARLDVGRSTQATAAAVAGGSGARPARGGSVASPRPSGTGAPPSAPPEHQPRLGRQAAAAGPAVPSAEGDPDAAPRVFDLSMLDGDASRKPEEEGKGRPRFQRNSDFLNS